MQPRRGTPIAEAVRTLFVTYRPRAMVGLALMASQAFFYNAIFFTYALVLTDFYGVPSERVGWYILPFALGNVLGPILLGRLFDTVGRRRMIFFTYVMSGLLLAITGYLFMRGVLSVETQTIAWMIVFFFASTAASSAYLTVSETFPLEIRALAIAIFYAIGTGIGGVAGPWIFGALIDTGSRVSVFGGYMFASVLMIGAAIVALRYGVNAERKPLEHVARPLAFSRLKHQRRAGDHQQQRQRLPEAPLIQPAVDLPADPTPGRARPAARSAPACTAFQSNAINRSRASRRYARTG